MPLSPYFEVIPMSVTGIPWLLTSRQAGSPGADQDLRNNKRVELYENSLYKSLYQTVTTRLFHIIKWFKPSP